MGTFSETLRLESKDGQRSVEVEALVDTGAFFTLAPAKLLRELGVEPADTRTAELADGRIVNYEVGQVVATVDPLLGAYALEGMGLAVDPVNTRLIPLRLRMVSHPSA